MERSIVNLGLRLLRFLGFHSRHHLVEELANEAQGIYLVVVLASRKA
jgi:hypothetical protein